jgi:hypothetical protein
MVRLLEEPQLYPGRCLHVGSGLNAFQTWFLLDKMPALLMAGVLVFPHLWRMPMGTKLVYLASNVPRALQSCG